MIHKHVLDWAIGEPASFVVGEKEVMYGAGVARA